MGGQDWKKWQEDQDERDGPNAQNPKPTPKAAPKNKKKVLTAQSLKQSEPSPDFPDTVDD